MKVTKVDLGNTGVFSNAFLDYLSQSKKLSPFYEYFPDLNGFKSKLQSYSFDEKKRSVLQNAIVSQYSGLNISAKLQENISALQSNNTFTVTTGHQLNIFSGPLYFIYKIITVVNLAKKLKEDFPDKHIVPVYWMASEDHDFEEINHFHLFGKKLSWQSEQKGAVGRFDPSGILEIFNQVQEQMPLFRKAYSEFKTLAEATRFFVNELFGHEGLIVIDADHKELKTAFRNIIKDELLHQRSASLVNQSIQALDLAGYKAPINPREINLFYLDHQLRERIVREGDRYRINNTTLSFSKEEILALAEQEPEKFSPNVLLRPLYEEIILPNICYTGGPAEIVYWLELKNLFQHYQIPFPILLPRNFVLFINKGLAKKLQKLSINEVDLFLKEENLISKYLSDTSEELYVLAPEKNASEKIFLDIAKKAEIIDPTLVGYVMSENQKTMKILEEIEKRLKKGEQKKNADAIAQVTGIRNKLFPENSLQERHENFLNFSINDPAFIQKMQESLDPLDFCFHVVIEENSGS